VILEDVIA